MKKSCFGLILLSILSGTVLGTNIWWPNWRQHCLSGLENRERVLHHPNRCRAAPGRKPEYGETEKLSTQIELTYSEFGFGKVDADNGESVGPLKINYLKIGCAIKLHPVKDLNIHIGPEIGFQIIGHRTYLTSGDFGAFAGVEKFFTPNIGIGARYYLGFSDINEDPELKQRNRALQFSLLLRLNSQQLAGLGF